MYTIYLLYDNLNFNPMFFTILKIFWRRQPVPRLPPPPRHTTGRFSRGRNCWTITSYTATCSYPLSSHWQSRHSEYGMIDPSAGSEFSDICASSLRTDSGSAFAELMTRISVALWRCNSRLLRALRAHCDVAT